MQIGNNNNHNNDTMIRGRCHPKNLALFIFHSFVVVGSFSGAKESYFISDSDPVDNFLDSRLQFNYLFGMK